MKMSDLGMITISISKPETESGFVNRNVAPVRFVNADGKIYLEYRAKLYSGKGLTDKCYYIAADTLQRRSMDRCIDIHNSHCDRQGITNYCAEWNYAANQMKVYEVE